LKSGIRTGCEGCREEGREEGESIGEERVFEDMRIQQG